MSIKTLEEWRTWLELKIIQPEVKVLLTQNNMASHTQITGFRVKGMNISIKDGYIYTKWDNDVRKFSLQVFLYNLRGVMKVLFEGD